MPAEEGLRVFFEGIFRVNLGRIPGKGTAILQYLVSTEANRCWQAIMEKQGSVGSQILTLPVCCVCGLIRDENGPSDESVPSIDNWVTKQTYRKTHGVDPAVCRLTHTYCPSCYTQFMNRIVAA